MRVLRSWEFEEARRDQGGSLGFGGGGEAMVVFHRGYVLLWEGQVF